MKYGIEIPLKDNKHFLFDLCDIDKTIGEITKSDIVRLSNHANNNEDFVLNIIKKEATVRRIEHKLFNLQYSVFKDLLSIDFKTNIQESDRKGLNLIVNDKRYNIYNIINKWDIVVGGFNLSFENIVATMANKDLTFLILLGRDGD